MKPLLQIENLSVHFQSEKGPAISVNNISLSLSRGELLALVGESGSGKSVTSLSILGLLPQPPAIYPQGRILFTETESTVDLLKLDQKALQKIRGHKIGMIFQEPMTSLNPVMRCGVQVMEALRTHKNISKSEAKKQTIYWFDRVKLPDPDGMFHRYPHQLSGGQKQRVMIALAMCCQPALLICDEPTTALDVTVQKTVLELIAELQREQNMAVLFITHDLGVVAQIAHRVAIMYKGGIVEEGQTETIFKNPAHPYTKALIACRPDNHPKGQRLPTVSDFMDAGLEKETPLQAPVPVSSTESTGTSNNDQINSSKAGEALIDVQNLTVQFKGKTSFFGKPLQFHTAVKDVSFSIFKNETLGLVGESGCGKTTLGRTMLRMITPTSGRILYRGTDITKLAGQDLKHLRKEVQLIFQDPYSSLNPRLTIGAALLEPMTVGGVLPTALERRKRVADLLDKVSLPADSARRYPHQFSGGQRQRIVIARALATSPDFLVCDESVSALDVSVQAQVLNLLNDLKRDLGLTLLFISHDLSVVQYMCSRILVMQSGQIVESGLSEEVYQNPQSAYTKSLLKAVPRINT